MLETFQMAKLSNKNPFYTLMTFREKKKSLFPPKIMWHWAIKASTGFSRQSILKWVHGARVCVTSSSPKSRLGLSFHHCWKIVAERWASTQQQHQWDLRRLIIRPTTRWEHVHSNTLIGTGQISKKYRHWQATERFAACFSHCHSTDMPSGRRGGGGRSRQLDSWLWFSSPKPG